VGVVETDIAVDLRRLFGHPEFRPGQREAVEAFLAGRDVLAVMPTGSGKSLCYQLPALVAPGVTLVVSPLIALMQDQHGALRNRGIDGAEMLTSAMSPDAVTAALDRIRAGEARLVYVAPERFTSARFLSAIAEAGVARLAVDEAHCLSEWGHDFRPDYLRLADVRERLGSPPTMALTATATPRVAADIAAIPGVSAMETRVVSSVTLDLVELDEPAGAQLLIEHQFALGTAQTFFDDNPSNAEAIQLFVHPDAILFGIV